MLLDHSLRLLPAAAPPQNPCLCDSRIVGGPERTTVTGRMVPATGHIAGRRGLESGSGCCPARAGCVLLPSGAVAYQETSGCASRTTRSSCGVASTAPPAEVPTTFAATGGTTSVGASPRANILRRFNATTTTAITTKM